MSNVYFQPGAIVGGQCEIIRPVGIGKMGVVYLCRHVDLPDMLLALKVLTITGARRASSMDDEYVTRFQNELTATYRINNPHVVRTYGYIAEEDWVGYTMEYVDGCDLHQLIKASSALPIPNLTKLLIQACDGVQAIHNAGIIHRDLKPANILINSEGNAKITDFGIARMPGLPRLTATGNLLGTFEYLSPQYLQDGLGTTLGDIYALGVIGFEMVTGNVPFNEVGLFNMITEKVEHDPPLANSINQNCPPALAEVISIALRRDTAERYQSAQEMKSDLELIYQSYQYEDALAELPIEALSPASTELDKYIPEVGQAPTIVGGRTIESIINPNVFEEREEPLDPESISASLDPDYRIEDDSVFLPHIKDTGDPVIAARAKLNRPSFVSMSFAGTIMAVGFLVGFAVLLQLKQPASLKKTNQLASDTSPPASSALDQVIELTQGTTIAHQNEELSRPLAEIIANRRARLSPQLEQEPLTPTQISESEDEQPKSELIDGEAQQSAETSLGLEESLEKPDLENQISKQVDMQEKEIISPPEPQAAIEPIEERKEAIEPVLNTKETSLPKEIAQPTSTPKVRVTEIQPPVIKTPERPVPVVTVEANPAVVPEPASASASENTLAKADEETDQKVPDPLQFARLSTKPIPTSHFLVAEETAETSNEAEELPLDMQVRATLLFRFADYIEWPSSTFYSASAPVQVCVFGTSRFSNYLAGKARINKTRSNRNFNLLRLSPEASPDELKHCQIVYLDAEYSKQAGRISSAIASEPVLFVSEATGKGIIDFVILERRVKFTIDSAKAQKAGIRVGTVLFDLAIGSNG